MLSNLRARMRRVENSNWVLVIGGFLGVLVLDGMLLAINLSVARWGGGGDLTIQTQYGDLKAWWLVYAIMTAVGFAFGAVYATESLPPTDAHKKLPVRE